VALFVPDFFLSGAMTSSLMLRAWMNCPHLNSKLRASREVSELVVYLLHGYGRN
jgi:hypothetical protein